MKIAIVTDSNSGITLQEGKDLGIFVLPMPFMIEGQEYFEEISLSQEEFYDWMKKDVAISTSQPSIGQVLEMWEHVLQTYDCLIHIPMSSGLSQSCETARMLAKDYPNRVYIVDNQRISVTQRQSVLDALKLIREGKSAPEIVETLERTKSDSSIYITVNTLKYLKRGGRVTPAGAAIGDLFQVKPVLQIDGGKLDAYAKALGMKKAKRIMLEAMKQDIEGKHHGDKTSIWLEIAYTEDFDAATKFAREVLEQFPGYDLVINPLSLSVACHIGPGALALACCKKI